MDAFSKYELRSNMEVGDAYSYTAWLKYMYMGSIPELDYIPKNLIQSKQTDLSCKGKTRGYP